MVELQIACLGDFQVTLAGALTTFQTDKSRALLAYLALERREHQRTTLAQFLWPGYGEESARNSLRQVLYQLRQILQDKEATAGGLPPWLLLTRQTVQLNPDAPIHVDSLTFRHLLATCASHSHGDLLTCASCLARLRQAVDLYRGDFLAGFTVADSAPFEEWRRITQEQLHIQMLNALTQLAAAAEVAGDDEQAIQTAHRLLTLEPWLEAAHRQIMRLLAQRGQRAAALAQYQRCRQVLAEELGVEPDDETTALYEEIRSSQAQTLRVTAPMITPLPPPLDQPAAPVKLAAWLAQLPLLLGRADELTRITTLLDQPTCRLVTLVGPPGVGKTRLAQAVLAVSQFEHGSYFIELAALRDPTLLATTMAHALTAAHPTQQFTGERLVESLRDQTLLLVLDNFEQVLPGGTLVGELLAHCPQIKVLITSRARLHLSGEQVITVHPLPLPALIAPREQPSQGTSALATVANNEAVQLFCQRAAAVVPGFVLTERLAPVVVEICRRLDGLPLAIELAAAHSRLLPPPALLERLTQRLALLTTRSQARPERQQTLRAAIAWSYELLDAEEQRLFRQLTVFAGGATLGAIEAVIGNGQGTDAPSSTPHALLASLEALLDKSLLRQSELPAVRDEGEQRVLMLETLREYGWELLAAAEAGDPVTQKRHADYFLNLAETTAPKLHGPDQVAWLDRLALDHDNLRAALTWFVQAGEVHKALRLATALRYFWRVRGHYREGYERLLHILGRPEAAPTGGPTDAVRARALNAAGYLQWVQGNTTSVQTLLHEALTLSRAIADAAATAFALRYLGLAADARQEQATAHQYLEESLAIYRTLDTPNETALALMYLGDAAFSQQAYDEAQRLYQESAELLRQLGNNVVLPYALRHLGYLALARGNLNTALRLSTESLHLNLAAGEQQGSAAAVTALAAVAAAGDHWEQAARLLACVTAWMVASGAQLLPLDRTYYEETQRLLQQQPQQVTHATPPTAERLALEQVLAYVFQELTFDDEPGRQGDKEQAPPEAPFSLSPALPVALSPAPPHNLPAASTAFIGRTRSLAEVVSQLQTTRLLTLVGPGGMGKTRLGVEVGRERLVAFADGVWFVPLASITTPAALAGAIATALGLTFHDGDPHSALLQNLRPKHLLLILDNFEQLLPAGAGGPSDALDLVVALLEAAPRVQILVTSRQRLNLRSEQIYAVPALSFAANATLAEATALAAVRLFVQAVQRVQADFQLSDANLAAVLRICQLVQGMPLGLELAAANAFGAPLTAIADAIEQSTEFLAVEWRDLPARQRSMRAVFAWSWQLLSTAEQHALRQSAVFRGGFAHSAAQAVIGTTLPILTHLVHKSLLQWQEAKEGGTRGSGEERYLLHELLRQFAAEELNAAGERAAVEEQHGRYYLAYLAARGKRLGRYEPKEASAEIQAEVDNARLAWQWAATQGRLVELEQAAYAWWQFCRFQGLEVEGRQSFAAAIAGVRQRLSSTTLAEAAGLLGNRLLARLLAIHANFLYVHGRNEEMTAHAREAIDLGRASGDGTGETFGTFVLGRAAQEAGRLQDADTLWRQTLELVRRYQPAEPENEFLHDVHWMTLNALRASAFGLGDYAGSRAYLMQALQICQALGKRQGELISLSRLAQTNFLLYEFAAAEAGWCAALDLARALGYRRVEMLAQEGLGGVSRLRGDYAAARRMLEQAVTIATERAAPYEEAAISATLIRLYTQLGDQAAAEQRHEQLTQLLARFQLIKESQLYAHLAAASKAHVAGARQEALRHAEQANQLIANGDIPFRVADTNLILGHTRAAVEQWEAAATAFHRALAAFQQFADAAWARALAAEPRAGLAQIALAQSDLTGAQAQVEAILPVLGEQPRAGYNNPFFIYLACSRVLVASGDARAATLLQQGYTLLQQDAATLDDASRQRFLQAVPLHRELVAAYVAQQAPAEKPQTQVALSPALSQLSSLPIFSTPLVGRAQALTEINSQLQRPEVRLITLMGPGGMGKTRLAVEIGQEQMDNFADGVWFVSLAPISSATALPAAIATTLGFALQGDDPRGLLLQLLRPKRLLLILDNFEHLLAEGAEAPLRALDLVVDLLECAPGVQVIVTSRERLKLRGEQIYPVQALPFVTHATLAEAATTAAVHLFVHSVQRLQADFQLTATNLAAVLRICRLVEGMPLGLELAAANAGSAPLHAIADAIEQNIEFLTVDWRDLPERQRSMRAVFAWSWRLLSANEQRILRQSAVFRGGFDYRAAQAITAATLPLLTRLIDKSLLQWQTTATGEGRYVMHDLLKQFVDEELQAAGEQVAVEERHGRYYLTYLAARGVRLGRAEPKEASAEIQVELNNIRQAWQWAATQGRLAEIEQAVYAWWQFCQFQGLEAEGRQSFELAVEGVRRHLLMLTPGDANPRWLAQQLLAKVLAIYANYLFAQGRDEAMAALAREAIALGAACGGFEGETFGTFVLGRAMQELERKAEARALWLQTIQLVHRYQPGHPDNELLHEAHWMAHNWLRGSALHFGDYADSRAHMVEAVHICQTLGKRRGELFCLSALAEINFFLYDFVAAETDYMAVLRLARSLSYRRVEMSAQEGLSRGLRLRGDYTTARTQLQEAVRLAAELAFPYDEALFLAALIRLDCQLGNQAAVAHHDEQLTQLLARVKLAKECQLYGKLAATVKAAHFGAAAEALRHAEQADQINKNGGDILFRLVDTALILGHASAAMGQWQAAAAAFQEALAAFQQFAGVPGARTLAAEPQAGLAQIALAQGDRAGARTQVAAILPVLAQEPRLGYNNPFFIYLTAYRVLVANQDERAAPLLRQGYDLLQQDAAKFDEESRQRFLTAVPWHRELVAAYAQMQEEHEQQTRRQGDKESGAPPHPLTPSPPHPVALSSLHNLPVLLAPLIGRERELAEITTRLEKSGVRLLTLIGPGGMGKTRLALAVGRQQLAAYPDGVWFVALAALNTPAAIGPTIANALGVTMPKGEPGVALGQFLAQKRLLLILDNIEHLLSGSTEGVTFVTALLQSAPAIQILVTSRERLHLRGEQVYRVPSLTFSANATLAEAGNATAVRVFVQYAQLNQAHFQLNKDNLAAVLRICQLVQGMPLGLELASAHVGTLPLNVIADEIAASAEFLQVNWHDLLERQRSMRAVFDWSWHLLDENEQRALRKVAIFRGGFTREAAQAVTGVTLPTLTRLAHRSLLYWEEQGSGGRYAIHELLRQFAAEQLARITTEQEEVAARHSEFYLDYLAVREARLTRAEPRAAAAEIQVELDNIRQAWQCAVQRLDFATLQRSAWALFAFYRHTGSSLEALQTFQALAEQILLPAQPDLALGQRQPHAPARSSLLAIYAYLLALHSKLDQAIVVAQQALALAEAESATDTTALSHFSWGVALRLQGNLADAQFHLEKTLQLASLVTAPTGKSEMFYDVECLVGTTLGGVASDWGLYPQAREHFGRSLQLAQTLGKRRLETNCLINLANLARMTGEYATARQGYEDALRMAREVGYRWGEGTSQLELGDVLRQQGEYSRAAALLGNALTILQEIGEHDKKAIALTWLGLLYAYVGDFTEAEGWLTRYQQFTDQAKGWEAAIHQLQGRTMLALHRGELAQALAYASAGWQIGQTRNLPDIQAYGLIGIGHAQRQLGQLAAATTAYQQAFDLYIAIQRPDLAAEAQAGLATLAQQQGDLPRAQGQVEAVLAQLAAQPMSGQDEPFFLYLICYQVLAAAQDPRAPTILQQGYRLLQHYAEQITEDRLRQSFLENVPLHRALQQAYTNFQANATGALPIQDKRPLDQVTPVERTSAKVTIDKLTELVEVTESPNYPVRLSAVEPSPTHLVSQSPLYNLPTALPPLIGRERDLAEIVSRLRQPGTRLLTLAGPGGMGKTRLALAAAAQLAPYFVAGVCLVELAEVMEPALLPQTVAAALGQTEPAEAGGEDPVARYLRDKPLLLVLDNCEYVDEAAAYWSKRWLSTCPMLRILATSHGALTIPGEVVWPVTTLAYPPTAKLESDQLLAFAAVQLFVARAQEVKADFAMTAANSAAIAEICRRLEGIPLALELAAARIRLLTPAEIAVRLNQGIAAALANNRSAPARHQTMQAALDWSFASLDADEQLLFQQLAVFAGGFTLHAVESVTQLPDALDLLERLLDRALVITETLGEQTRYRLLGVIRKYADDKLSASSLAPALRKRHAAYFLHLAESAQMDIQADGEALWLQPEAENLSSAMDWALTNTEAGLGVRLAGALTWYWWMRGQLRTQRPLLQQALVHLAWANQPQEAAGRHGDAAELAIRAFATGALLALWEESDKARLAFTQALALAEAEQNQHLSGLALRQLAAVAIQQKAYGTANAFIERGLAVWQALGGTWHIAWLYAHQGDLAYERGDQTQAWLAYEASTRLPVNPGARAYPFRRMAYLALARGERNQALALCRESLQLNCASGDRQGIAACLVGLARFTVAGAQTLPQAAGLPLLRRAAELLGAVEALLQTVEGRLLQADEVAYQQTAHLLQEQLAAVAPQTYQAALAAGRALTVTQATALALQEETIAPPVEPLRQKATAGAQDDKSNSDDAHPVQWAPLYDWAEMPTVDFFVERQAEVAQLTAWLTPTAANGIPAQLISILGMGGMGKTTLAAMVTKVVAPAFAVVIWRSLLNAPALSELLRHWLQTLARQTLTTLPESLDEQLRLLLTYLQQERCLLVLDNVESIFVADTPAPVGTLQPHSRAGVTRPGYEDYAQLFQHLANSDHQSCLLLTSREQPYALLRSGRQAQAAGRVQVLSLTGLDHQAGAVLLQSNGLHASAAEAAQLIENYSGNPLALQIVAATIADFFGGNVAAFQQEEGQIFDGMRLVLDQQFARLSPLEREILLWLAIEREPVTVPLLRSNFVQPVATAPLLEALQALQNRSLLEKRDSGLTLQNVIIEYTTTYLIERVCEEILDFQFLILDSATDMSRSAIENQTSKIQPSFLNRFALLKAQAKAYVRQSQSRLIVQPIGDRLTAHIGKAKLTILLQRLIGLLQTSTGYDTGYVAGNLLNLLVQLGVELHGYDLSRLTIREAYLQGTTLAGVSLAYAKLQQCVFTTTFGAVLAVAISPDDRLLAAASNDGIVRLWQLSDNQLYAICEGHTNVVRDVAFSPDGRWLASASLDQTVRLWEVATGQLYRMLEEHTAGVYCITFCGNGALIASGSRDGKIQLWDRNSGRRIRTWHEHTGAIQRLVAAPGGTQLASGSADQTIRLWDIETDQSIALFCGHTQNVSCLAFSPDGALLASGSADQTIRLWDMATGVTRHVLHSHEHWLRAVAFSPDGTLLASGSADQTVRLWDVTSGQVRGILHGHTHAIWALAFTADSKRLISGGTDHQLRVWDVHNPVDSRTIHTIQAHVGAVLALAVSPDGQLIATGEQHKLVRVWEVSNGRQVCTLAGHTDIVTSVAFSPDSHHLVSTGDDGVVRLWDIGQRREVKTLIGHPRQAHRVAYHPNGALIASSGHQDAVRLWELRPPALGRLLRLVRPAASDQESAYGVAFSPDGRFLASTHGGDKLCVWDVASGQHLYTLQGHQNGLEWLAWSPNSTLLASGDVRGNLYVWDMRFPALMPIRHFAAHTYPWHLAFSPDSRLLASVGEDPLIRLWNIESGACVQTFSGHTQNISSVVFLPDGETLVSGSFDGTIRFWAVHSGTLLTTWPIPGPYAGLNITGVTGISDAQKAALCALGAVEE